MTASERQGEGEISMFALGSMLLVNRWRIARWMFIGGVVAALWAFSRPALYRASASFVLEGNDARRSGLASLAGQFDLMLPTGNQPLPTGFYSSLLKSPVILRRIARDTLLVQEMGGKRISFLDLFKIQQGPVKRREDQGVRQLMKIVTPSVGKTTGIVEVSVTTRWPSVSLTLSTALVKGLNEFNVISRQGQAAAERSFVQGRLAVVAEDLRLAEDREELFLKTNRDFRSSPELTFAHERLQRDVVLQQQVFTTLTQSYEEARIREVRDTPVITMVEPPTVSSLPEPRRRAIGVLLGLLLGAIFGSMLAFMSETLARRRNEGDVEVDTFIGALGEVKDEILQRLRR